MELTFARPINSLELFFISSMISYDTYATLIYLEVDFVFKSKLRTSATQRSQRIPEFRILFISEIHEFYVLHM